jgi:hypothetical protein
MPYSTAADTSDLQKLQLAFAEITKSFGSLENVLEAIGLADLPSAQRYGILIGGLVFLCTVVAVVALLVFGGSFQRIAEQQKIGSVTISHNFKARLDRPLLLERLLESRERMMKQNYPNAGKRIEGTTALTKMLLCMPPPPNGTKAENDKTGYLKNYVVAYRKCQDKPGGASESVGAMVKARTDSHLFYSFDIFRWHACRAPGSSVRSLCQSLCRLWRPRVSFV